MTTCLDDPEPSTHECNPPVPLPDDVAEFGVWTCECGRVFEVVMEPVFVPMTARP